MVIALVLIKIDYSPRAREIIVRVDISLEEYGEYLGQRDIKARKVRLI